MGRLWGSQRGFDRDGDGRLNAGEWRDWYLTTFGHDIEMEERRQAARTAAGWKAWLDETGGVLHAAAGSFLRAAGVLLPGEKDAERLAWQAFLCQVTAGLIEGGRWNARQSTNVGMFVGSQTFYPYRALAYDLAELSGLCSGNELENAVLAGTPLFLEGGGLTAERCGTFWQKVIARLPPYCGEEEPSMAEGEVTLSYAPDTPWELRNGIEHLASSLFPAAAFFAWAADGEMDRRNTRLLKAFAAHWRALRGTYEPPSIFPGLTARQLLEEFPQLRGWSLKELGDMCGAEILGEMYRAKPERALQLWRSLAGTAEPLTDPQRAEDYFYEMEPVWYAGGEDPGLLRPVLEALEDEPFARQMFQSAFVNYFHQNILRAARTFGRDDLAEHWLDLLEGNPLPREDWELGEEALAELRPARARPEAAQSRPPAAKARAPRAPAVEPPDDGTVFHYCAVRFQNAPRPYAYLTGGLLLQAGDWVEAPFGRDDLPRRGQVVSVTDCTRPAAPWPPERTKTVLRLAESLPPREEAPPEP